MPPATRSPWRWRRCRKPLLPMWSAWPWTSSASSRTIHPLPSRLRSSWRITRGRRTPSIPEALFGEIENIAAHATAPAREAYVASSSASDAIPKTKPRKDGLSVSPSASTTASVSDAARSSASSSSSHAPFKQGASAAKGGAFSFKRARRSQA